MDNGSLFADIGFSSSRTIRAEAASGNHTFRATGITAYLNNGRALEHAQSMTANESPRTSMTTLSRTCARLRRSTAGARSGTTHGACSTSTGASRSAISSGVMR